MGHQDKCNDGDEKRDYGRPPDAAALRCVGQERLANGIAFQQYLLQAALLVWIYLTPIIYPADLLGRWAGLLDANPLTGVVGLARWAALGGALPTRSAAVAIAAAVALLVVAAEVHRRHDRRFVDLL